MPSRDPLAVIPSQHFETMRTILTILFLSLVLTSCEKEKSFSKDYDMESYLVINDLENIHRFNNTHIEISGEFHMDFENIYLEKEGKKIWLNFDFYKPLKSKFNQVLDGKVLETFNSKIVKIKGKLSSGKGKGHLGTYDVELNDIVHLEI